ncbi:MAG: dihydrofolate reductase [Clostridia bacterium]|nr:dihydrofolate reductase [Clostridia bacterium]
MKAILHADLNWGIGKSNGLMFKLPADMQYFKKTTIGNVVVMGSNTLLSFPGGKPLKDRTNIVLWPDGPERDDCIIVRSLDELFSEIKKYPADKVFVVGGQMMYRTLLPYCTEILVTKVYTEGDPDAYFENLDKNDNFRLISQTAPEETNGYTIRFTIYKNMDVKEY